MGSVDEDETEDAAKHKVEEDPKRFTVGAEYLIYFIYTSRFLINIPHWHAEVLYVHVLQTQNNLNQETTEGTSFTLNM